MKGASKMGLVFPRRAHKPRTKYTSKIVAPTLQFVPNPTLDSGERNGELSPKPYLFAVLLLAGALCSAAAGIG